MTSLKCESSSAINVQGIETRDETLSCDWHNDPKTLRSHGRDLFTGPRMSYADWKKSRQDDDPTLEWNNTFKPPVNLHPYNHTGYGYGTRRR